MDQAINLVRGLSPYPAAWLKADGQSFKIFDSKRSDFNQHELTTGTIVCNKNQMLIKMNDGWMEVLKIQAEGKKRLPIDAFLRGFDVNKLSRVDEAT